MKLLEHVVRVQEDILAELRRQNDSRDRNQKNAERQKRYRVRLAERNSDVTERNGDVTRDVTVTSTPEVVKALVFASKAKSKSKDPAVDVTVTQRPTEPAWKAYSAALWDRHKVAPLRDATTNSQMARFVKRVGKEAAEIAAFYVGMNDSWYVSKRHPVNLLLRDAETLRSNWLAGGQITPTQARQTEQTQARGDAFAKFLVEEKNAG